MMKSIKRVYILAGVMGIAGLTANAAQTGSDEGSGSSANNRSAVLKSLAEHEFGVKKQECDTLRFDANANATAECMKKAEAARDQMMSGNQNAKNDGQSMAMNDQTKSSGTTMNTELGQSQGQNQGQTESPSVVEKVKDKVKETWQEVTGSNSGKESSTSQASTGQGSGFQHDGGMMLKGAGGVALFCQPINNMQPQSATN